MHNKTDFPKQDIDGSAIYVTCKEIVEKTGRSRTTVFLDIKKGKLPAIWGSVFNGDKPNRSWLVHPDDAKEYIELNNKLEV